MTAIVADTERGVMAADKRCTSAGPICHVTKIFRVGKSLFGIAGDVMLALHIIKWLEGKRDPAQLYKLIPDAHRNDVDILELAEDGLAFWNGWGVRMPILDKTAAIGSGSMPALQALRLGKDAEEAIRLAFPMDECSGGDVQVEYLLPPELSRRKRGR